LYLEILREFVVGSQSKVVPYISNCLPTKLGEFSTSGRSCLVFLKLEQLKPLEKFKREGAHLSVGA
jgi:hypothetical protein